jgi:hypothetical protein
MSQINHEKYAKKIILFLVNRVLANNGGSLKIHYGELAKEVGYPEPYTGNLFGNNIGHTLGKIGDLIENLTVDNWIGRVPFLQTMITKTTDNLPSYGLSAFVQDYDTFSKEEKKNYIQKEYEEIQRFGIRWYEVLDKLGIKYDSKQKTKIANNFYVSGESEEHKKLKEYIKNNGYLLGYSGSILGTIEYPITSGDVIDVAFRDEECFRVYEAKSKRSNDDDLLRGVFQCVKYKGILEAEKKVGLRTSKKIDCSLVVEKELPSNLQEYASKLGVKIYVVKVN